MSVKNKTDVELFDPSDVEWEVLPSKRRDRITIQLTSSEGTMNVMKTYLALKIICEKIEAQLNILEQTEGEH